MTDFLEKQDDDDEYIFVNEYVDDGVSGTTDEERENFQQMLADIQKGKINCVIVKNLARSFPTTVIRVIILAIGNISVKLKFANEYRRVADNPPLNRGSR